MIPGAVTPTSACINAKTACNSGFCGNALVTVQGATAPLAKTICCKYNPCLLLISRYIQANQNYGFEKPG